MSLGMKHTVLAGSSLATRYPFGSSALTGSLVESQRLPGYSQSKFLGKRL